MPKSKSKSKTNAPAARRQQRGSQDDVVRFYSNQLDAFRFPDMETSSTAVIRLPQDNLLSSGADGNIAFVVDPRLTFATATNATTTGNLGASWSGSVHPNRTTLTNNSNKVRQTGCRVTVRYSGPEQSTSGTMYVGSSQSYSTSMISAPLSNFTAQMQPYTIIAGGTWVFYMPMYAEPRFADEGNAGLDAWMPMVFFFTGLPVSQAYVTVRSERSFEYVPDISSSLLVEARPEPYDPVGLAEAGVLSGTGPEESPKLQESYAHRVGQAMWTAMRATARGAAAAAREDMRDLLQQNQMPVIMG